MTGQVLCTSKPDAAIWLVCRQNLMQPGFRSETRADEAERRTRDRTLNTSRIMLDHVAMMRCERQVQSNGLFATKQQPLFAYAFTGDARFAGLAAHRLKT
jgi:hypothetical protein